mgnify:CR=1 FL=1
MTDKETKIIQQLYADYESLERIHLKTCNRLHTVEETLTREQSDGARLIQENRDLRSTIHILTHPLCGCCPTCDGTGNAWTADRERVNCQDCADSGVIKVLDKNCLP